ncbi:MAG: hypothetical protein WA019_05185 [Candidatus Moraniibacteriota bacterium]
MSILTPTSTKLNSAPCGGFFVDATLQTFILKLSDKTIPFKGKIYLPSNLLVGAVGDQTGVDRYIKSATRRH